MTVTLSRSSDYPYVFINGDLPEPVVDQIDQELRYEDPNKKYSDSWKSGDWDGYWRLLRTAQNGSLYFPVGLLTRVKEVLDVFGIDYEVTGVVRPGRGDLDVEWNTDMELREYQQDAVDECLRNGSGLVVMPTASGKTLIGLRLIYEIRRPTLVTVHVQEVADQWAERIEDILGIDVARYYGGDHENGDVMVALYQSIYDDDTGEINDDIRLDHEVFLPDETHRLGARTFSKVAMACPAQYRFGFTATPERPNDNAMLRVIGGSSEIIADLTAESLIDQGYLAKPTWRIIDAPRAGGQHRDWRSEYQAEIVENSGRNQAIAGVVSSSETPCLITVERIAHGERLESVVDDARFVHGSHSDRSELIQSFRDGDLDVLIATRGIVGEGFDMPEIRTFVVAGGYKSETATLQQVGRALRPGESGEATIVDFQDYGQWVSRHSGERVRTYQKYYGEYGP